MTDIKISSGNTKIGKISNISLPPGVSCARGVKCFSEGCYARKAYRLYPASRKAWDSNWDLYVTDPESYMYQLSTWMHKNKPALFRYHVSGDFPGQLYVDKVKKIAEYNPSTTALAFTKQYDFDYSFLPENLNVILSVWPSMPVPKNPYKLGMAWLEEDPRWDRDGYYLRCPGNCFDCGHQCWKTVCYEIPVIFPKH